MATSDQSQPGFIEGFYQCGRGAACDGASLRDLFETFAKRDLSNPAVEAEALSFVLGFADELLTTLRAATKPRSLDLTLNINIKGHLDEGAKLSLMQAIEAGIEKAVRA
ncbi:hypothetical protein IP86_10810 [Rhodopseudomonas sp. AAP120]|uniref:hypothetical protein n=1 Tax=Rhodopseudomonas sp. AAP120 TaxID=1523430 RepID=UPI0006B99DC9|nr:hypothetical protein [Rhodopseudomonas sp. AAP120]KPF98812.1 hypothetical protein IP86_10810 [Rhodopseudomonas sp. AAP120]